MKSILPWIEQVKYLQQRAKQVLETPLPDNILLMGLLIDSIDNIIEASKALQENTWALDAPDWTFFALAHIKYKLNQYQRQIPSLLEAKWNKGSTVLTNVEPVNNDKVKEMTEEQKELTKLPELGNILFEQPQSSQPGVIDDVTALEPISASVKKIAELKEQSKPVEADHDCKKLNTTVDKGNVKSAIKLMTSSDHGSKRNLDIVFGVGDHDDKATKTDAGNQPSEDGATDEQDGENYFNGLSNNVAEHSASKLAANLDNLSTKDVIRRIKTANLDDPTILTAVTAASSGSESDFFASQTYRLVENDLRYALYIQGPLMIPKLGVGIS